MINDTSGTLGAKPRDYFFTVLAVDPVALPLVRLLAAKRWLTPDQVSWLSLVLAIPIGIAFSFGTRPGLIVGAVFWYLSFVFDCVDGKLARMLGTSSPKGAVLDSLGDGARRASGVIGIASYLWQSDDRTDVWLAIVFGILAFYFIEISGGERTEPTTGIGSRWSQMLARHRLLPNPGMTDVSAIVFVIGPVTGLVEPALWLGIAMVVAAILRLLIRLMRSRS
jgi:phosphatidylglycerophosphate synthase